MYTGQLDIGEGSVPSLVSTAQFLDMPLLEQLLQTHALSAAGNSPAATPKAQQRNVRTPVKANYSIASPKSYRASPKSELLPAGPSRIDLEVTSVPQTCFSRSLLILRIVIRWETLRASSEVCPSCRNS